MTTAPPPAQPPVQQAPPGPPQTPQVTQSGNLPGALIAGAVAAAIGALAWGGITYATGYQIGWIAIGVGFLAGVAVRAGAKGGNGPAFGAIGAAFALAGCVCGNFLAIVFYMSHANVAFSFDLATKVMGQTTSAMDFLFYGIALWEGWKIGGGHGKS